eukprot:Rhum_TRINITY_DN14753_c18_g1::Rhum_TRINITY_DN14753_c18_g1_i1::g.118539::m.118539
MRGSCVRRGGAACAALLLLVAASSGAALPYVPGVVMPPAKSLTNRTLVYAGSVPPASGMPADVAAKPGTCYDIDYNGFDGISSPFAPAKLSGLVSLVTDAMQFEDRDSEVSQWYGNNTGLVARSMLCSSLAHTVGTELWPVVRAVGYHVDTGHCRVLLDYPILLGFDEWVRANPQHADANPQELRAIILRLSVKNTSTPWVVKYLQDTPLEGNTYTADDLLTLTEKLIGAKHTDSFGLISARGGSGAAAYTDYLTSTSGSLPVQETVGEPYETQMSTPVDVFCYYARLREGVDGLSSRSKDYYKQTPFVPTGTRHVALFELHRSSRGVADVMKMTQEGLAARKTLLASLAPQRLSAMHTLAVDSVGGCGAKYTTTGGAARWFEYSPLYLDLAGWDTFFSELDATKEEGPTLAGWRTCAAAATALATLNRDLPSVRIMGMNSKASWDLCVLYLYIDMRAWKGRTNLAAGTSFKDDSIDMPRAAQKDILSALHFPSHVGLGTTSLRLNEPTLYAWCDSAGLADCVPPVMMGAPPADAASCYMSDECFTSPMMALEGYSRCVLPEVTVPPATDEPVVATPSPAKTERCSMCAAEWWGEGSQPVRYCASLTEEADGRHTCSRVPETNPSLCPSGFLECWTGTPPPAPSAPAVPTAGELCRCTGYVFGASPSAPLLCSVSGSGGGLCSLPSAKDGQCSAGRVACAARRAVRLSLGAVHLFNAPMYAGKPLNETRSAAEVRTAVQAALGAPEGTVRLYSLCPYTACREEPKDGDDDACPRSLDARAAKGCVAFPADPSRPYTLSVEMLQAFQDEYLWLDFDIHMAPEARSVVVASLYADTYQVMHGPAASASPEIAALKALGVAAITSVLPPVGLIADGLGATGDASDSGSEGDAAPSWLTGNMWWLCLLCTGTLIVIGIATRKVNFATTVDFQASRKKTRTKGMEGCLRLHGMGDKRRRRRSRDRDAELELCVDQELATCPNPNEAVIVDADAGCGLGMGPIGGMAPLATMGGMPMASTGGAPAQVALGPYELLHNGYAAAAFRPNSGHYAKFANQSETSSNTRSTNSTNSEPEESV